MSGANVYSQELKHREDQLAIQYLPAVKAMSFRLKERLPSSIDYMDLCAIGTEELVKLARRYDESQNDSFWGYAKTRVYGAMLDYLRSLDTVSRSDRKLIKDVDKIVSRQFGEHGEEPTDEEISKELGVEIDKVREARSSIGVFNVLPLGEQLQVYKDSDTLEGLEEEELIKRVRGILDGFTQREQTVIQLYYFEELKLDEISEILGITISRISQIHRHVLSKIRETLER